MTKIIYLNDEHAQVSKKFAKNAKVAVQLPNGTRKEYKIRARQDRKVADRKSDSQTAPRRLPNK